MAIFFLFSGCGKSPMEAAADFFISDEEEVEMGKEYDEYLRNTMPVASKYSPLSMYIDSIGRRMVDSMSGVEGFRDPDPEIDFDYSFSVVNEDVVNAFAVPGGFIYIYKGLIEAAKNEAEIAGVIAHEMGHVVKKHGKKHLLQNFAAEQLTAMILGDESLVGAGVNLLLTTKFSRMDEFEADSCGLHYAYSAKYNPYGFIGFFNTLDSLSGGSSTLEDITGIVSTHPPTEDRIEECERIILSSFNEYTPSDSAYYYESRYLEHMGNN